MIHYSEVGQDIFALETAKLHTYIEIGGAHPIHMNNTYLLEKNNWTGYSIEIDNKYKSDWNNKRKNKIHFNDAVDFVYPKQNRVGYLSCDINPPDVTVQALKNVIEQGIVFDCITFEHDDYLCEEKNYNSVCAETKHYLQTKGYKVAVDNVFVVKRKRINKSKKKFPTNCHFETWYVNKDINFQYIDYENWKNEKQLLYKL